MSCDPSGLREKDAQAVAARLARQEGRRLTAALLRVVGGGRLAFAEDCVQEALAAALESWPRSGMPADPFAWVLAVARNKAVGRLRRAAMAAALEPKLAGWVESLSRPAALAVAGDEELTLLVMCCHPDLEPEARLALTLKSVCGFSVPDIARAFLAKPETVAQRLVRAKARVRALNLDFALPSGPALNRRMPSVLKAVYLLFDRGYRPATGGRVLAAEICGEALRLARAIAQDPRVTSGEAWALRALLAFQHSRAAARIGPDGGLVLLPDQDRARWDGALIAEGFASLRDAMRGGAVTALHWEAGAASVHAAARRWEDTDWSLLLSYYDGLMACAPSVVAGVNRAVAVAMRDGAEAGLAALSPFDGRPELADFAPYQVARAEMLARAGRAVEARQALTAALSLELSEPERRLAERRLAMLAGRIPD
jgi:RNA polymerase sigma-70 factor (ECF subfamily)